MERKEREEYEIEIKEKEPMNECIKIRLEAKMNLFPPGFWQRDCTDQSTC